MYVHVYTCTQQVEAITYGWTVNVEQVVVGYVVSLATQYTCTTCYMGSIYIQYMCTHMVVHVVPLSTVANNF